MRTTVKSMLFWAAVRQIVTPVNSPQFVGVANQVRYLGVRMDLNNASAANTASEYTYGWIGIKITNEADATGEVVGWGYETQPGVSILAGDLAPGTPATTTATARSMALTTFCGAMADRSKTKYSRRDRRRPRTTRPGEPVLATRRAPDRELALVLLRCLSRAPCYLASGPVSP